MSEHINYEVFDKSWRQICDIEEVNASQLRAMVKAHYLGKWPAIQTCSLAMYCGPFVVGMCIFSEPPLQTSIRYGGKTWELARLWIRDYVPRNAETWLIGKAIKHVKANYSDVQFLVSYADPSAGHSGTIYKAANWESDGRTDEGRKSPRCDYVANGKKYSRMSHIPDGAVIERVPRVSKYRFVYRLI